MTDKYSVEELIEDVRDKMEDEEYDTTRIIRAANWAQSKLVREHKFRFMQISDNLSVSEGDTFIELPDNFLRMTALSITSPSGRTDEITEHEIPYQIFSKQYANFQNYNAAKPTNWCLFAEGIRFSAPSDGTYDLPVDYIRRANKIESESDDTEFPWDHGEILACMTAGRLMRIEGDFEESDKEFEMADELLVGLVATEGMGQGTSKPKTINQRRFGPVGRLGRYS